MLLMTSYANYQYVTDFISLQSSHPVTISDVHSKCNSSKSEQVKLEEDLEYLKNEYDREVGKHFYKF